VIINPIKIYFIKIYAVFIANAYLSNSNCILASKLIVLATFFSTCGGDENMAKIFSDIPDWASKNRMGGYVIILF
jgi:hypothetical protein